MNRTSIVITLLVAAVMFAIGVFALPGGVLTPPAQALPVFALLLILESAAFGAGVAYLVWSRGTLFGPETPALRRAVAFAVVYLLLASWPHDALHRLSLANGVAEMNWFFLAGIEYVFHFGIVPVAILFAAHARRRERAVTSS